MITNILTSVCTAYVATGNNVAWNRPVPHRPVVGLTIAVPRQFPLGCRVIIDGHEYCGEDRTAKRFDGRFDIFMATRNEALTFGKQTKTVIVISDTVSPNAQRSPR